MKILVDAHTHTLKSGHAFNTLNEMVMAAKEKGLEAIAITEHGPMMPDAPHLYYFQMMKIWPEYLYGVRLLRGVEADILNIKGELDITPHYANFTDVVIASMHPTLYDDNGVKGNTEAAINAMQNNLVQIIGHPDDSRRPVEYKPLVKAAKESGVLLELNAASLVSIYRKNARENCTKLLEECALNDVMICINSDAHMDYLVGEVSRSINLVDEVGFPHELIANTTLDKFLKNLRRRG